MNERSYTVLNISPNVWKLSLWANLYYIDFNNEKIIIDSGRRADRRTIEQFLSKILDFEKITKVIFTHFHSDHIGNFDLFPKAQILASKREIDDFRKNPFNSVLDGDTAEKFEKAELIPINEVKIPNFEIIHTPGHTRGSICIWYPEQKTLFSGDTMFKNGIGRTDLPTSEPRKMQDSLNKLVSYNFKSLCAGHDYEAL